MKVGTVDVVAPSSTPICSLVTALSTSPVQLLTSFLFLPPPTFDFQNLIILGGISLSQLFILFGQPSFSSNFFSFFPSKVPLSSFRLTSGVLIPISLMRENKTICACRDERISVDSIVGFITSLEFQNVSSLLTSTDYVAIVSLFADPLFSFAGDQYSAEINRL